MLPPRPSPVRLSTLPIPGRRHRFPLGKEGADLGGGASAPKSTSARRVLVVEDNLDTVRTLVKLLKAEGHQVEYAINGYAAISVAAKFQPEVVILDLGLPGLSGFEVCARLKREPLFKSTRFIAVSGYNGDEDRRRSRAAGCDVHLPKPADPKQILALVAG